MSDVAIELIYRGIFQKTLAQRICRGIVLATRRAGKVGIAFSRYSDSPERNGIPAKQFAVVADDPEQLQATMAKYQPSETDVTIVLDDTLCKGIESWAWDGLHPVNELLKPDGVLLVVSGRQPGDLVKEVHRRAAPYNLAVLRGEASFSGMWVFKDDHSDVRVLGALATVCPQLLGLPTVEESVLEQYRDPARVESARGGAQEVVVRRVEAGEGNPEQPFKFRLPPLAEMEIALVVRGAPAGKGFRAGQAGFEPGRNPHYRKYSTRSMRPVTDFDACTKCGQCWLLCPDSALDTTPEGYYDVSLASCCGCGVCEESCPAKAITMVSEAAFSDNASQYLLWRRDRGAYRALTRKAAAGARPRSHGLHHWKQYQEEARAKGGA